MTEATIAMPDKVPLGQRPELLGIWEIELTLAGYDRVWAYRSEVWALAGGDHVAIISFGDEGMPLTVIADVIAKIDARWNPAFELPAIVVDWYPRRTQRNARFSLWHRTGGAEDFDKTEWSGRGLVLPM
ncbi:hypothetical protein AB0301_16435 [Microbacterium profundi]|uniref:Uncharacterized protein n=1 Tax=Microbacterium profundi TaxID=450380 RepID=A0ABV3LL66_9MICO